jgi:two-component system, NtrC family, nitrogen regulation response regulator NtrX
MAKNILVIDDEGLVTKTLKKLLSKAGYNPIITESGREALEKAKTEDFDLVVSDIRMPDIDGIETIQKLRQIQTEKGKKCCPEILITGYADEEKYKSAVQLKVAEYLFKPFDTNQFMDAIKRNLDAGA